MTQFMSYVLAIVGSTDFVDQPYLNNLMGHYTSTYGMPSLVVSGGAKGVDTLARNWARWNGVAVKEFRPDWSKHGRAAGVLRNSDIINEADRVIAIHVNNSRGTADSIKKAKQRLPDDRVLVVVP